MNPVAIQSLLAMILEFAPKISSDAAVQSIINVLVQWLPIIIQFFKDEIPVVKNIISILRDKATAPQLLDQLDILDTATDADYDSALADLHARIAAAAGTK